MGTKIWREIPFFILKKENVIKKAEEGIVILSLLNEETITYYDAAHDFCGYFLLSHNLLSYHIF